MPSLKDIRTRIGTVKNTKKITSAMKLVAAAKMARAQERVAQSRPYAAKMRQVIDGLSARVDDESHPLLRGRENPRTMTIVVVSSDRGLCGGFNANLLRTLDRFIQERRNLYDRITVATLGRKGATHFREHPTAESYKVYEDIIGQVDLDGAKRVARDMMDLFVSGEADEVYLAFNEFVSAIKYNSNVVQLLPMVAADDEDAAGLAASDEDDLGPSEYVYEPDAETLLARLLPSNVEIQILQALLESDAAEQSARMVAMDNATNNAEDMINSLTLQYNRARQAYITKELVEIVSGAEALKG